MPDGRRLYAASASLNAVAIFDLSKQHAETPIGFIPTEWYPSALALTGDDLIIASAKGRGSGSNGMRGPNGLHIHTPISRP